jgi:hypothetical protein
MGFAREVGDPQFTIPSLAGLVEGRSAAGSAALDEAIDEFVATGFDNPGFTPQWLPFVARPMIDAGRPDDVARLVDAARWGDAPWLDVHMGAVRGLLAEAEGDLDGAVALFSPVWEVGDSLHQRFWATTARVDAARCLLGLGRAAEAHALLDRARTTAEWMGATRLTDQIAELHADGSAAARA